MTLEEAKADLERRSMRGATSTRLRNHNARAVLSLLRSRGSCSGAEISKALNVSAQTASVLVKVIEEQGLIQRLDPIKGKVGKPQVPLTLAAEGAYSFGLRIGRRAADLTLVDFLGTRIGHTQIKYAYPTPDGIENFVQTGIEMLLADQPKTVAERAVGLGIAAPFEIWNWLDGLGAPRQEAEEWLHYDFQTAFARFTDLPVHVANDVNTACAGEVQFGVGKTLTDFAYFYMGSFIGGAVVLNGTVYHGRHGNAGAFGSMLVGETGGTPRQLIDLASIFSFEQKIATRTGKLVNLRAEPELWKTHGDLLQQWLASASHAVARAAVSVAAVLDVSDVVVDGVFPDAVRKVFCDGVDAELSRIDQHGIHPITCHEGELGIDAGPLGAAYHPILQELLVEGSDWS